MEFSSFLSVKKTLEDAKVFTAKVPFRGVDLATLIPEEGPCHNDVNPLHIGSSRFKFPTELRGMHSLKKLTGEIQYECRKSGVILNVARTCKRSSR